MTWLDWGAALRTGRDTDPDAVSDLVASEASLLGASDVVVYLVDLARVTLEPMPDRSVHVETPQSEQVASTMAGRAFLDRRPVVSSSTTAASSANSPVSRRHRGGSTT